MCKIIRYYLLYYPATTYKYIPVTMLCVGTSVAIGGFVCCEHGVRAREENLTKGDYENEVV